MKYEVKNISNATYAGAVRIKRNETVIVTKEIFTYLENTFGKFDMFEFTKVGKTKVEAPKETKVEAPKETKVEALKETKVEAPKETNSSRKRKK